jgi:high-affinity iron transporter
MGFLPQAPIAWDTSLILDDHGFVGGFLNGLVGYRARPSLLEVGSYLLYLVVAGTLLFRSRPSRPQSSEPRGTGPGSRRVRLTIS